MARKKNRPNPKLQGLSRLEQWLYVQRFYGLSHAAIQMAKELSMGPQQIVTYEKRRVKRRWPKAERFITSRYRNKFGRVLTEAPSLEEKREAKEKARAAFLAANVDQATDVRRFRPPTEKEWNRARARFRLNEELLAMARATGFTPQLMDEVATGRAIKRGPKDPLPLHATKEQIKKVKRVIRERYAAMTGAASGADPAVGSAPSD